MALYWGDETAEPWVTVQVSPEPDTVPVDRRCPGCGQVRDGCESALCSRRKDDDDNQEEA